jgi:large subunit ribosomal protein L18
VRAEKLNNVRRWRRRNRVRKKLRGSSEQPRLCVYRSNKHIYCQLIDDEAGKTLTSASTRDQDLRDSIKVGGNRDAAKVVGKTLAERAEKIGIKRIKFDRGSFRFHGRVAELAAGAREGGLEF